MLFLCFYVFHKRHKKKLFIHTKEAYLCSRNLRYSQGTLKNLTYEKKPFNCDGDADSHIDHINPWEQEVPNH